MKRTAQKYLVYNSDLTIRLADTQSRFLSSESFMKSSCMFRDSFLTEPFDSCLFTIEGQDTVTSKFVTNVTYSVWFYLKHMKTGKYLGLSEIARDQQGDIIYDLELKENESSRYLFRLKECYIYQSKISNYVKPGEELYLVAKLKNQKEVFLSLSESGKAVVTYNSKRPIVIDFYAFNIASDSYSFSNYVLITHSETQTYLRQATNEQILEFEELVIDKDYNIRGLWLLQSENLVHGGNVNFEERVRFKNIYSKQYLSFGLKAKIVDNYKIYPVTVQKQPLQNTIFKCNSIRKKDGLLKNGSYITFQNCQTLGYLSNSIIYKNKQEQDGKMYIPQCTSYPYPSDVYKLEVVSTKKVWSVNALVSIQAELNKILKVKPQRGAWRSLLPPLVQISSIYELLLNYLNKLQSNNYEQLSYFQRISTPVIELILQLMEMLFWGLKSGQWTPDQTQVTLKVVRLSTEILKKLVFKNLINKQQIYKNLLLVLDWVCMEVGVEELIIETFDNYLNLIVLLDKPLKRKNHPDGLPLLETYLKVLKEVCRISKRNSNLFQNLIKFIKICKVVLIADDDVIGYNQTYITTLLISDGSYKSIMFGFRVQNDRVKVDLFGKQRDIEDVPETAQEFGLLVEQLGLFSLLCFNRNMIAKGLLNQIFSCGTLINYLQMPISQKLKSIFFRLITNIYVDSNPRTPRTIPHNVLLFSTQTFEQHDQISMEESQMSYRLNEKLINKNGEMMRVRVRNQKLDLSNVLFDGSNQLIMQGDELDLYRMILEERIQGRLFSKQMFQSIETLMRLECLAPKQLYKIFLLLLETFDHKADPDITDCIFKLLNLLSSLLDEINLNRLITISKLIFFSKPLSLKDEIVKQAKYALPGSLILRQSPNLPSNLHYLIDEYNEMGLLLKLPEKFQDQVMNNFMAPCELDRKKLLFKLIMKWRRPKQNILRLFEKSIILTNPEDMELANYLFNLYKQLFRLNESSEVWLAQKTTVHRTNLKRFCVLLSDLVNFLYQSYQVQNSKQHQSEDNLDSNQIPQHKTIKYPNISAKRQKLMKNIGIHQIVIQFLTDNFFMLQNVNSPIPICRPFFHCFEFLHGFILKNNNENKEIIDRDIDILCKYLSFIELGQALVLSQLHLNNQVLCRRLSTKLLNSLINKITKLNIIPHKISEGQYSPVLANFFNNVSIVNGRPNMPNLNTITQAFSSLQVLHSILFLQQKRTGQQTTYTFNLDIKNILSNKVPFIYHSLILKTINAIFGYVRVGYRQLQRGLMSTLKFNYLIAQLAKPDLYTCLGVQAKLNYILKIEISKLFKNIYIYSDTDMNNLKNNEMLTNFLKQLSIQISKFLKSEQDPSPDRSMATLLQKYNPYLQFFEQDLELSYQQYLSSFILPLLNAFEGALEKYKQSENYLLIKDIQGKIFELDGHITVYRLSTLQLKAKILKEDSDYIFNIIQFPLVSICANKVDEDQHSQFVKNFYVQMLLNQKIADIIVDQQLSFFQEQKINQFIDAVVVLACDLAINSQEGNPNHEEHLYLLSVIFQILLKIIANNPNRRNEFVSLLIKGQFFKSMLQMTLGNNFNLIHKTQNTLCFKLFDLINNSFGQGNNPDLIREIVSVLTQHRNSHKMFTMIKDTIIVSSANKKPTVIEKSNSIFQKIKLSYDGKGQHQSNIMIALELISNLANNSQVFPFASYLRQQKQSRISIDFLPLLVNAAFAQVLQRSGKDSYRLDVTYGKFELICLLIKTIQNMLYGPNEQNQVFLMETKFPSLMLQVMKTDSHPNLIAEADPSSLTIIQCITQVLNRASQVLKNIYEHQSRKERLVHDIMFHMVKHELLQCVKEIIKGNDLSLRRLTLFLPEEYLKVNLIWVYNSFMQEFKGRFTKQLINDVKLDIDVIYNNPDQQKKLVLQNGFIIYELIKMYADVLGNQEDMPNMSSNDQQKKSEEDRKVGLVKRFFELLKVDEQPIALTQVETKYLKEIKMYHQTYKEAVKFFGQNSISVEVNFQDKIFRIFFQKMPVCNYFDDNYKRQFREKANRISQTSKLHSLMQTAVDTLHQLEIEQTWNSRLSTIHPYLNYLFDIDLIFYMNLFFAVLVAVVLLIMVDSSVFQIPYLTASNISLFILQRVFTAGNALVALLLILYLSFKKISSAILQARKAVSRLKPQDRRPLKVVITYLANIFTGMTLYIIFMICMNILTVLNPAFAGFLLIDVFRLISTGRNILTAVGMTWRQLLAGIIIFVLMNYVYASLNYIAYSSVYDPTCKDLYYCFLFLNDGFFKQGPGYMGLVNKDYSLFSLDVQFFLDVSYIIFVCTVIKEIFSGTIIDKFSQLRQHKELIQEDEESCCYICGLQRYQLDFQLQGFQNHLEHTHNIYNYIFYIFYLKKKDKRSYSRLQKFVDNCVDKTDDRWFPLENSIFKIKRLKRINEEQEDEEQNEFDQQAYTQRQARKKVIKDMKVVTDGLLVDLKNTN